MSRKRKSMSTIINPCDHVIDDDDSYIVPIKSKRQRILSTSEDSDSDSSHQSPLKSVRIAEDVSTQRDSLEYGEESGSRCNFSSQSKPIEYFELFFDSTLWSLIVEETNKYSDYSRSLSRELESFETQVWAPVTALEMKAFIAVLLEMRITRRPNIRSYWSQNSRTIPWFRRMFSRNRFQQILKYFHLVDNSLCFPPSHEKYDPCVKFKPLVEHANRVFKLHYKPHKELSIDESLIGTLCHSSITQYLPNEKHHPWGIKLWMLCDSVSKYCLTFHCYKGAKEATTSDGKKFGLAYEVVVNLLKDSNCLNKGHHIFVDKFFTSIELAKYLYSMDTYLTGIIGRNKKCIPENLKEANVNEVKYFRDNEVLFCAYRERKNVKNPVLLISTKAVDQNVTITRNRHGREIRLTKPAIIQSYNAFMGGVDESDKMLYTYLDERRSVKCWKQVAFNIISRMVLNAYIIYKERITSKAMNRLD
ncbi:PREDICTED: piggyBac transposable element-derived protein 4-like, partial [Eufriesea mexicana]|uniref:piggyBac transposable element-derived protein 4-like n=1 Tax=Eufriesea mexicana TaxID=516756 RepID=UPI00083BDFB5